MTSDSSTLTMVKRARAIFPVLVLINLLVTSSALAVGWQSGELKSDVIEPLKQSVQILSENIKLLSKSTAQSELSPTSSKSTSTSTVETRIETNINITNDEGRSEVRINGEPYKFNWIAPTQKPYKTPEFNTNLNWGVPPDVEAWWEKALDDFNLTKEQNQRDFEEFDRRARENQEKFRAESRQKVEDFKAKYGF